MSKRGYTLLGWAAWKGMKLIARQRMGQNKGKLAAAATVAAVVVAGALAAKAASDDDDG